MEEVSVLNEYLANTLIETHNLWNLKINAKEKEIQKEMENLENQFLQFSTSLAKQIKKWDGYPITNLPKIEEISQIKSMQSREYNKEQIHDILQNDFSYLKDYTKDLIEYFSKRKDFVTSHLLLKQLCFLEKW